RRALDAQAELADALAEQLAHLRGGLLEVGHGDGLYSMRASCGPPAGGESRAAAGGRAVKPAQRVAREAAGPGFPSSEGHSIGDRVGRLLEYRASARPAPPRGRALRPRFPFPRRSHRKMMRSLRTISLAALLAATLAAAAGAEPKTLVFDRAHSEVGFDIRHFFNKVHGRFTDYAGQI